jgi:peroxiredoxin Q/BCP
MPRIATKKKRPVAKSTPRRKTVIQIAKKPVGKMVVGAVVPDFSLPATRIKTVSRAALKGKPFVIYFYPKDNTSGCTAEACDFRDNMAAFNKLGVTVIGVSKDSLASHEKFAKKFGLGFPLAADEDGKICEKFGVWIKKSMYGRSYMGIERATFLVDTRGIIRGIWHKVSVPGHVLDVKKEIAEL